MASTRRMRVLALALALPAGSVAAQRTASSKPAVSAHRPLAADRTAETDVIVPVLLKELDCVGDGERYVGFQREADVVDLSPEVMDRVRRVHRGLRPASALIRPGSPARFTLTTVGSPVWRARDRAEVTAGDYSSGGSASRHPYQVTRDDGDWVAALRVLCCGRWRKLQVAGHTLVPARVGRRPAAGTGSPRPPR